MTEASYPSLRIRFVVQGITGTAVALLDTGYDGYLAVPETLIAALPRGRYTHRVRLTSGQTLELPAYLGTVELIDRPGPIAAPIIAIGDEYLLGLSTLNHFRGIFDHGQRVIVEP
jgi:predicted aspartyl protease